MNDRAAFTSFQTSTREDWQIIKTGFASYSSGLADRVLAHFRLLKGEHGGFPVDRMDHSLQTATLAARDGRDEEYVVCALLHDIGDTLGAFSEIAAAILSPFVSEKNLWMIRHHAIFQGRHYFHHVGLDRDMREQFRASPFFDYTAEFCDLYDSPAFDPAATPVQLAEFEPMVRRVFSRPLRSIYTAALEAEKRGE